jgi:hypothetical protein
MTPRAATATFGETARIGAFRTDDTLCNSLILPEQFSVLGFLDGRRVGEKAGVTYNTHIEYIDFGRDIERTCYPVHDKGSGDVCTALQKEGIGNCYATDLLPPPRRRHT